VIVLERIKEKLAVDAVVTVHRQVEDSVRDIQ
jgi:hypothetical protein